MDIYSDELILLNNIEMYFDDYKINKILEIDYTSEIRYNMGLCEDCDNIALEYEGICQQCCDGQQTTEEEILNHNKKYYSKLILEDILNEYINNISYKLVDKYNIYKDPVIDYENNIIQEKKTNYNHKKFLKKYKQLKKANEYTIEWSKNSLITNYYRDRIRNIIDKHIYFLEKNIKKNGKDIDLIRNTFRYIYCDLYNSWEMDNPDEKEDIDDLKIILKQKWEKYSIYE
jgi:hypothetical protein